MITLNVPIPPQQMTAAEFIASIKKVDNKKRESIAYDAIMNGHVPSYMREFVPVEIKFRDTLGDDHSLVINVLPDGLTIGADDNRLRMPFTPLTAQKIADHFDCVLPTTKIVTEIWKAGQKVEPQPWGPPYDASMQSTERIVKHNDRVEETIKKNNIDSMRLLSGHKKDIVITNKLLKKPNSVAIFGWIRKNGKPIQPTYLGHEASYLDYSHFVRLISKHCVLDHKNDDLCRILQDTILCGSVSSEGPLQLLRQPGI